MVAPVRPSQHSLFGGTEPAPVQRGSIRSPTPAGYASPPGSGPQGETCGTCKHCVFKERDYGQRARRWYKCDVMLRSWTNGRASDVLITSPACRQWQPGEPHATHMRKIRDRGWED